MPRRSAAPVYYPDDYYYNSNYYGRDNLYMPRYHSDRRNGRQMMFNPISSHPSQSDAYDLAPSINSKPALTNRNRRIIYYATLPDIVRNGGPGGSIVGNVAVTPTRMDLKYRQPAPMAAALTSNRYDDPYYRYQALYRPNVDPINAHSRS